MLDTKSDLFTDTIEFLKTGVVVVGSHFTKPDDDWVPGAFLMRPDATGIMPLEFADDAQKDFMAEAVAAAAKDYNADVVGFVMSAWLVKVDTDKGEPMPERGAASDPRRIEVVNIAVVSADNAFMSYAPIIRDGENPPTIGAWEDSEVGVVTGRFTDAVMKVLAARRNKRKKVN